MNRHKINNRRFERRSKMYSIAKAQESLLDKRNEQPLTIALATIVLVWTLAFGLTTASTHFGAHMPSDASVMSSTSR